MVFPWVSIFKAFPVVFILELIDLKLISNSPLNSLFFPSLDYINPSCANPTKWSNTIKQFVDNSWRIVWVCLTILWVWPIKGSENWMDLWIWYKPFNHSRTVLPFYSTSKQRNQWFFDVFRWDVEAATRGVLCKKRIQHKCCPMNIAKFLRTLILKDICKWLLLEMERKQWPETSLPNYDNMNNFVP